MAIEDEILPKSGVGSLRWQAFPQPRLTREQVNDDRRHSGMIPATFHYQEPTPEMLTDPLWNAIWDEIKTWDVHVPTEYAGYCGATGNHATAIYLAIKDHAQRQLDALISQFDLTALLDQRLKEREELSKA